MATRGREKARLIVTFGASRYRSNVNARTRVRACTRVQALRVSRSKFDCVTTQQQPLRGGQRGYAERQRGCGRSILRTLFKDRGISIEERDAASIQCSNKFEKNYKRLGINIGRLEIFFYQWFETSSFSTLFKEYACRFCNCLFVKIGTRRSCIRRRVSRMRGKKREIFRMFRRRKKKGKKKVQRFAMRRLRLSVSSSSVPLPFRSEKIHEVKKRERRK